MHYQEIRIDLASEHAPPLVELLYEFGLSFQECDETTLDPPPRGRARYMLYLGPDERKVVPELYVAVQALLPAAAQVDIAARERDEDEWRDVWKRFFSTRRLGRIAIVPSWEAAAHVPEPGEVTLTMDPGRAFGTGGHASTRLCLRLLDGLQREAEFGAAAGLRVLDLGCGCGVLGIAALLMWPQAQAVGLDIDPEAVEVTVENAAINRVSDRLRVDTTAVSDLALVERFEIVLANITGPTLIELAEVIVERVAPGGVLILSGVLTSEATAVRDRFIALGLRADCHETEEEWTGLLLRQPHAVRDGGR